MILTQHYLARLSHASYLIGDETSWRAVVVDPCRDVGAYLREAQERGLRIERVIETHVHADFVSGHLELATPGHTPESICVVVWEHPDDPGEAATRPRRC